MLARQFLLERRKQSVTKSLEHLVGLQAQVPQNPYVALWTRLEAFRPEQLSRLIETRRAVRLALQRSTIHLVTRRDCLTLRPVLQPALDRNLWTGSPFGRRLKGVDLDALLATGRALVEEAPRTPAELGKLLREKFPDRDGESLANALRNLVPLVQVPPRGLWERSGQTRLTTAVSWLGGSLARGKAPDKLVLRYLAAFGPASVQDAQLWSGLTGLHGVFTKLRKRLRMFRDEHGTELYDLPLAPRPHPDTPVPPRFLPEYDNVFLSHVDRTRIVGEGERKKVTWMLSFGTVLVDGFLRGAWRIRHAGSRAVLHIQPVTRWSLEEKRAVAAEGERLLAFVATDASRSDVVIRKG